MSTGQALLEQQDEDAGELSYTDKQVAIIRAAVENPDADVNEIADMSDSHVTYVRSVLDRADPRRVQEELGLDEPAEEATQPTEPEPEPEEEETEAQQVPEDAQVGEWEETGDAVPVTLMIPRESVNRVAQAISDAIGGQAAEEPEVPHEMVRFFSDEFGVPEDRARHIVLRLGTERAEEIMDEADEPADRAEEIAEAETPEQ